MAENSSLAKEYKISEEKICEYEESFAIFDKDGSGTITVDELRQVITSLGTECTLEEAKKMIAGADTNKNETIEFAEFVQMMERSSSNTDNDYQKAFDIFDKDGDGKITHDELKLAMKELGQELTDFEIDEMIKEADLDNDHQINFTEFKKMMCK